MTDHSPLSISPATWAVTWETDSTGKPICALTKGKDWVRTKGRVGCDQSVLFERAWIEALLMDLASTTDPEERRRIENDLGRARKDEMISQALRRDAAEALAARIATVSGT